MPVSSSNAIAQADMDALALLANTILLPKVNAAIAANENGWASSQWVMAGGKVVSFTGVNVYDVPASRADGTHGILNPQPAYGFDPAEKNWADEFNRIRGDLMAMVFTSFTEAPDLFHSSNALSSGPWCVGLNDNVTFKYVGRQPWPTQLDNYYLTGILMADIGFPAFKGVSFVLRAADLPGGFNGNCGAIANVPEFYANDSAPSGGVWSNTMTYTANHAGTWSCKLYFPFSGPSGSPPAASAFTKSITPDYGWTWDTFGSGGNYVLVATLSSYSLSAGSAGLAISVTPPALYAFTATPPVIGIIPQFTGGMLSDIVYATSSTVTTVQVIEPSSATGKSLALPDVPANSDFTVSFNGGLANTGTQTFRAQFRFQVSNEVNGVWLANTLPAPGRNVYLDQNQPQFLGGNGDITSYVGNAAVAAIFQSYPGFSGFTQYLASSMRMRAGPMDLKVGDGSIIKTFAPVQSSMTARPAPYLVRRDTDFVPYDFGFTVNGLYTVGYPQNPNFYPGATLNALISAGGVLLYGRSGVGGTATGLKMIIVQAGTLGVGWRSGVYGYGTPVTGLNLYVRLSDYPDPTHYDIKKTDGQFIVPGDTGGAITGIAAVVAATGYYYAIENPGTSDMLVDIYFEQATGPVSRQYFPAQLEPFSYIIDGTPRLFNTSSHLYVNKKIPQNGYTIFRLRATRLPQITDAGISVTPSTGAAITATVGQNILQLDGSLLFTALKESDGTTDVTITIPLDARDSGDVPVFWPVLGGNELVYQCATQIILEAWVDWQPIFNNSIWGMGYDPHNWGYLSSPNSATAFQYALGFINGFSEALANYPPIDPLLVQFPVESSMYSDVENLLSILNGGSLQTGGGNVSGGAGGTGSAGGSGGGAGGPGGSDDQM